MPSAASLALPFALAASTCSLVALAACSSSSDTANAVDGGAPGASMTSDGTAAGSDASPAVADASGPMVAADGGDAGVAHACPTTGAGAIFTGNGTCLAVAPTATGADSSGDNASKVHYALSPPSISRAQLVLFLNGTGAHPGDSIASETKNFYNAALALGYQVLALSYHSTATLADQCNCADGCYFPSRETIIRGVYQAGAAIDLQTIRVDESIAGRAELALRWLVQNDSSHAWASYLTSAPVTAPPETQIDWTRVVVAGHSQGGGHAAAIGKLFPVVRVVQLSATCDTAAPSGECGLATGMLGDAAPATWTDRSTGTWATPAASFWGLDAMTVLDGGAWAGGDGTCFLHGAIWQKLAMTDDHQNDQGDVCGATTAVENHNASIQCSANFAAWQTMLR